MGIPKTVTIGSILLFTLIGTLAAYKKEKNSKPGKTESIDKVESISTVNDQFKEAPEINEDEKPSQYLHPISDEVSNKDVNFIWRLFTKDRYKLAPLVETITYKSRVPWLKGRSAWITDYASHYSTSRHFIARSLNEKVDYVTQKVSSGDMFNVLKKNLNFRLIIDLSRCKMWFYAHDLENNDSYLLKTYSVGLGRFDSEVHGGLRTPKGKFVLGDKVAIYKPGVKGYFQGGEIEMVQVFGTRWIPFGKEISGQGDNPKGYGFHGAPWTYDDDSKNYQENLSTIGMYESDGCIHLRREDIEELFSIVITKPTIVEIVSDYHEAEIPGNLKEIQE